MTTIDPISLAEFEHALTELDDDELDRFTAIQFRVAREFAEAQLFRPSDLHHRIGVLAAEEADRRKELTEHFRRQVDGDDTGGIVGSS